MKPFKNNSFASPTPYLVMQGILRQVEGKTYLHIQVPGQVVNRDYGLAFDLDITNNENLGDIITMFMSSDVPPVNEQEKDGKKYSSILAQALEESVNYDEEEDDIEEDEIVKMPVEKLTELQKAMVDGLLGEMKAADILVNEWLKENANGEDE